MHYLLHIDTSADVGTVAISGDGHLLAQTTTTDNRNFAALLNQMVDKVLEECNIELKNMHGVAVCAGPGSYTGLRIGMAHAKALCYVLDKPLLLQNKLTLLAYNEYEKDKTYDFYVPILKAREGEYFISTHDINFNSATPPRLVLEEELKSIIQILLADNNVLCVGDVPGWAGEIALQTPAIVQNVSLNIPSWATFAYKQYEAKAFADLPYAEPFYLKSVYTNK